MNADATAIIVGAGDVDGDGISDLVWYKPSTGMIQVWPGATKAAVIYPGTNATTFTPKAIADYDGDGKADLLWSNDTTLMTQIWPAFVKANSFNPGTYTSGFSVQK